MDIVAEHMNAALSGSASVVENLLHDAVSAYENGRLDRCEELLVEAADRAERARNEIDIALVSLRRTPPRPGDSAGLGT